MNKKDGSTTEQLTSHLQPELWAKANKILMRKVICEFAHELLVVPKLQFTKNGWGHYTLTTDIPNISYYFRAQILSLDHWHIDMESIQKRVDNEKKELDVPLFISEIQSQLEISPDLLPSYLEEILSTLYGSAYILSKKGTECEKLAEADYQTIEHAMTGHPTFIANNGRIGFDAMDYRAYAPETENPVVLLWLAAHKSRAAFSSIDTLNYRKVLEQELQKKRIDSFDNILKNKGLNPESYYYIPIHPWQWYNKLAHIFVADIASQKLLCLDYGDDAYLPQQAIRTFFNISNPKKFYVKTALSIRNMGFIRGLSPYYMGTTPDINQWVNNLIEEDPYLQEKGFSILREVATIGYRNHHYEAAVKQDSPYKKMLASLWRESPMSKLQPGQRLMTMAGLLHTDNKGSALLSGILKSSGLETSTWIRKYLNCYLSPILHLFYYHDLVFMPHGENLILVLENNIPVKAIMKDIAEETGVLDKDKKIPADVERLSIQVPDEYKLVYIFTDIFDCFFRYLAHILVEHESYPEALFWQSVAECIIEYQKTFPELEKKFKHFDLFAPDFLRCCLNRLQLSNNKQMVNLADPIKNLKFVGTLKNPIAAFKTKALESVSKNDIEIMNF